MDVHCESSLGRDDPYPALKGRLIPTAEGFGERKVKLSIFM